MLSHGRQYVPTVMAYGHGRRAKAGAISRGLRRKTAREISELSKDSASVNSCAKLRETKGIYALAESHPATSTADDMGHLLDLPLADCCLFTMRPLRLQRQHLMCLPRRCCFSRARGLTWIWTTTKCDIFARLGHVVHCCSDKGRGESGELDAGNHRVWQHFEGQQHAL